MKNTDARVDAYIAKAAEFARPILIHLRELVHRACPDVVETIKWGMPHFDYCGAVMCHMAAFKKHCVFGFWRAGLMEDTHGLFAGTETAAMGQMGRITSRQDLPADRVLMAYIKQAARLNKEGARPAASTRTRAPKPEAEVPDDLAAALRKNAAARRVFEAFPPSHRREYIEWITEAKTEATRTRRLQSALEMMAEGRDRNWKYRK